MMNYPLPISSDVAVDRLAGCFSSVTNSYKFYWFLSLLEHIKTGQTAVIPIRDQVAQMVALVWYPANYYRLFYGKQDQLRSIAAQLQAATTLDCEAKGERVKIAALEQVSDNSLIGRELLKLGNYVPYRFLRPFMSEKLRGLPDWQVNSEVVKEAEALFLNQPTEVLYRFLGRDAIELSPPWQHYLTKHCEILTGFCLWHLSNYLQRHNPNVANIAQKLFVPEQRDMRLAKQFWRVVFERKGQIPCIYSGKEMTSVSFSLDHFLPWRFVAHDLLWNLIPTPKEVNATKSDCLPDSGLYFDRFATLQYEGVQAVAESRKHTLLEDYILLLRLGDSAHLTALAYPDFRRGLYDAVIPQLQIAKNMGFRANWRYSAVPPALQHE